MSDHEADEVFERFLTNHKSHLQVQAKAKESARAAGEALSKLKECWGVTTQEEVRLEMRKRKDVTISQATISRYLTVFRKWDYGQQLCSERGEDFEELTLHEFLKLVAPTSQEKEATASRSTKYRH